MTLVAASLLAAFAVAPADRLALADRLFAKGRYEAARAEYATLSSEKALREDDILYRLGECDRMLGRGGDARKTFGDLLARFPTSRHADRARLMKALSGTDEERRAELRLLDTDRVDADIRASALYHIGSLDKDAAALEKCLKLAPKGRLAPYAKLRLADALLASGSQDDRRRAVGLMLETAFGGGEFAEESLYKAACASYGEKRYGEAATLLRRYMKTYPNGRFAVDARLLCAWCEYLSGKFADCVALCGDGATDDMAFLLAASANAMGDRARAKGLFASYLDRFPQGTHRREAELPLARLEFLEAEAAGDAAKALECASRAAAMSGLAADKMRVAWALARAGRGEEAARQYMAVASDFPGTPEAADAMFRKAMDDLREERWAAADLALAESLSGALDDRRRAEATYWRGVANIHLGHPEEGAEHLKAAEAKGLSPDQSREARLLVADCDFNAGRTDDAKAAYARLVREGAAARMSAAKILAVGKLLSPGEEAGICARALVGGDSPEWRQAGYALLGEVEEAAGSYAAAIESYRKCLAEKCVTEGLPRAAARLGALETANGEWDAAEATLRRAVELNVSDVSARAGSYLHLAEVAAAKGDSRGARGYATVVMALFEGSEFAGKAADILKKFQEGAE